MIKINLALKKQSSSVQGASQKGFSLSLDGLKNFRFDKNSLGEVPVRKFAIAAIVLVAAYFFLDDFKKKEIETIETELAQLQKKQTEVSAELQKLKGFEEQKKALEEDEKVLRSKIETIDKLSLDRQIPPKVLLAVANALPKDAWLESMSFDKTQIKIKGKALDVGYVSELTLKLKQEALFADVVLSSTEQTFDATESMNIAKFEYSAKRRSQ